LNYFSRQAIAGVFSLLFLVGQFASLVHSVDHPFHQTDDYCASFIHCEKYDLLSDHDELKSKFTVLTSKKYVFSKQPVNVRFFLAYSSRAPPVTS
jgi:hypothetical protein